MPLLLIIFRQRNSRGEIMQGINRRLHWRALLVFGVSGLALVALYKIALASAPPAPQQEVIRLETRINQLEQLLY